MDRSHPPIPIHVKLVLDATDMGNVTKKQRKFNRNSEFCLAYKKNNSREKNKIKQLEKHLKDFPNDAGAKASLEACKKMVFGR